MINLKGLNFENIENWEKTEPDALKKTYNKLVLPGINENFGGIYVKNDISDEFTEAIFHIIDNNETIEKYSKLKNLGGIGITGICNYLGNNEILKFAYFPFKKENNLPAFYGNVSDNYGNVSDNISNNLIPLLEYLVSNKISLNDNKLNAIRVNVSKIFLSEFENLFGYDVPKNLENKIFNTSSSIFQYKLECISTMFDFEKNVADYVKNLGYIVK